MRQYNVTLLLPYRRQEHTRHNNNNTRRRAGLCTIPLSIRIGIDAMKFSRVPWLLLFLHLAHCKQPSAPSAQEAPLRELPWAQLNFLHTTDTHGWHAGHLQEPQYSADWGDYISFATHLRARADKDGSDLLLIDTGDRVEGNGLYDASVPKGNYTADIFKQQAINVVTVGNHELYKSSTSAYEYETLVPAYKENYLASNLNITKDGKSIPFGLRYRKFTTPNQKIRVLAMGFIYNFRGNGNNTQVQKVQDTVNEPWFQDAIRNRDVDLFLIAGHVALRNTSDAEFDKIYDAIRREQWDTPIAFFGGHSHIRDFRLFGRGTEKKAYGIESGRYMETLGFLSISGLSTKASKISKALASVTFSRLYIDNNLFSLYHHSGKNSTNFYTGLGKNTSKAITSARKALSLDKAYGCAPQDYWLYRTPYPSNSSILTLLEEKVLPDTFTYENSTKYPAIVITNSGAVRFDVFKGPFTIDTTYIICPFTSAFRMIKNVPYGVARELVKTLNQGPPVLMDIGEDAYRDIMLPKAPTRMADVANFDDISSMHASDQQVFDTKPCLAPGYTTTDDLGDSGDDTLHSKLPGYPIPNVVGASTGFNASSSDDKLPKTVDLVYNEYIQPFALAALKQLGVSYGEENTRLALDGKSMTVVIEEWVRKHWPCGEKTEEFRGEL